MQLLKQFDEQAEDHYEKNKIIIEFLKKRLQRLLDVVCETIFNDNYRQATICFLLNTSYAVIKYKMQVKIHFDEGYVIFKCRIIKNSSYLLIRSNQIRTNYLHKHLFPSPQSISSVVNLDNGEMYISSANHYVKIILQKQLLLKEIITKCKNLQKNVNLKLQHILQAINEEIRPMEISSNIEYKHNTSQQEKVLSRQKVKKYINFSQVDVGLSQKPSQYCTPSQQTVRTRTQNLKKVENQCYQTQNYLYQQKSNQIFYFLQPTNNNMKVIQRQFLDSKVLQNILKVETTQQSNLQDKFICNQIQIENSLEYMTFKRSQNSIVKMYDTMFYYIQGEKFLKRNGMAFNLSSLQQQKQEIIQNKKIRRKMLLVKDSLKIQMNKQQSEDKMIRERIERFNTIKQNKILIQRNIVKMLSSATSDYFIKYYYSEQPQFKNKLMMEYMNPTSLSLSDHLNKNRLSISLNSKLHLLSHISNALRFLRYYKITHMDLNHSNILVSDLHIPKIIDFGQAFHQKLIAGLKIKYQPGFTLPYNAPQFFNQNTFAPSYDMYSFGMIMFTMFFNYIPLPHHNQKLMEKELKNLNYHNRWLLAPEAIYDKGKPSTMLLFLKLINKCFSSTAQLRPLPVWTTIIFKELLKLNNL